MPTVRGSACANDKCGVKLTPANAGPVYGTMCRACEGPHIAKCDREMAAIDRWIAEHRAADLKRRRRRKACLKVESGEAVDTGESR